MAEVESEISGKADASDFIQLSSTVADLSSAVANKADSSTVANLSSDVAAIVAEAVTFDDLNNGLSGLYAEVSADLASKAESSTVAALASEVATLPYVKTNIPETAGQTITFAAETRHVYGLAPYGNNAQISVTFPQPTNQIFDCIIDADCREAEGQIIIVFADTYFFIQAVGGSLTDLATLDPGEMYRLYLTQSAFVSNGKPVILVNRKQL
jgi:hypothetical protein